MSKGDTFEADFLKLIFQALPIANIADNAASAPITNIHVSLHSGDPGDAGNQTTSEVSYTGYARVPVVRSAVGWTVSGTNPTVVSPAAAITFGARSDVGSVTAGWWAVGTLLSGTGKLLYSGTISPTIVITQGVTPQLTVASTISEE